MFKRLRSLNCVEFTPSELVTESLEQDAKNTHSLHTAIKKFKLRESIPKFIADGADVNVIDYDGNTPLHLACIERCESQIIQYLIDGKVTVDALNNSGQTALDIACDKGYYELLPVLIRGGAAVNRVIDTDGNTILHKVFMNPKETIKPLQEILVRHGANLDVKNNFGKSPLDFAVVANNWLKVEWQLSVGRELKALSESQLRMAAAASCNDANPLLNKTVTYQLQVFGKYFSYKISKKCPKMPAEVIRKQLHFLWGEQDKYFDDIIDNVITAYTTSYKRTISLDKCQ